MRVEFLSDLRVAKLAGDGWKVLEPFSARIDGTQLVEVPAGFETDFASVPRLPLAYLTAGNTAHRAAVLHDYLYSTQAERSFADSVFVAAMEAEGIPWWRRKLMYGAVRIFGGAHYAKRADEQEPADRTAV